MENFNMAEVIKMAETTVSITTTDEQLVDGRVQKNSETVNEVNAAILPMTREDVEEYEGGNYTTQDIKIYVRADEYNISNNDYVEYDNKKYQIKQTQNWEILSDFKFGIGKKVVVSDD